MILLQVKKKKKENTSQKRPRQEKFVNKLHLEIISDIGSSLVEEFSRSVIAGLPLFFYIPGLSSWSHGDCHHSNHWSLIQKHSKPCMDGKRESYQEDLSFSFFFFYQTENLLTEAWAFSSPATNTCMHTHTHTLPCKPLPESDGQTQKSNLRKSMYGIWAFVVRHELHQKKKKRVKERKLLLDRKPIGGPLRNGITKYSCCFEQCTIPLPPLTAHPLPNALREYTSSHTSMHPRNLVPGACNISHLCTSVAYLFIFFCDHFTVFIKYCS